MAASSSTRWLGVVSALGLGTGCNDTCESNGFEWPPEPEPDLSAPPEVLAGEWIGPGVLELSFSRPIHSNGDLDPARFAIVGWDATQYRDGSDGCYLQTRYRELTIGAYYYYQSGGIAAVWIGPEDDTLLRVRMSSSAAQCQISSDSVASGIMLAYTNAEDPNLGESLRYADGLAAPDLGPAWAIGDLERCFDSPYCGNVYQTMSGHLPQLSSLAAIPCP